MKQLGNIEKLPSGSYRLRYKKNGVIYRKTIKCKNLNEAKKILNELVNDINTNTFQPTSQITFCEFAQLWLDNYAKPNLASTTWNNYIAMLNKNVLDEIGNIYLTDINKIIINSFLASLKEKGFKIKSQKNYLSLVSAILSYAAENDYIKFNPCSSIKLRKNAQEEFTMNIYEKDEIKKLFIALDKQKDTTLANAIKFDLYTGLRRGELLGLQKQDINFKTSEITISRSRTVAGSKIVVKDTKTHKSRTFLIPTPALEILKEQCKNIKKDDFVFNISPKDLNGKFSKILKENNLRHIRIYDLRHTNASMLHSEGIDYATIANRLGNLPSTTANFYIHKVNEKDKKAKQILDNIF